MKFFSFIIAFIFTLISNCGYSQVASAQPAKYYWSIKDFSKDIALARAKVYVVKTVLQTGPESVNFEMDPLAASSSGELTSLVYRCEAQNKEGLLLGFFGDKWNPAGVVYQAYAFKNLPTIKALELLNKIDRLIKDNSKYLNADAGSNNVTFEYDDLTFVLTTNFQATSIRVFWDDFDANWDSIAFKRTKRRLLKKLD